MTDAAQRLNAHISGELGKVVTGMEPVIHAHGGFINAMQIAQEK